MNTPPPSLHRTDTLFPYTPLFRALKLQPADFLSKPAQHSALTMTGSQSRDPDIKGPSANPQCDPAILRLAFFGNIQAGHDLDARDQGVMQCATRADDIAQGSVDPVAHNGMRLERLYMYVAGTIARSLSEQRVDHADDGRIVAGLEQVFDLRHVLHQAIKIDFVGCGIHDFGSVARLCIRSGQERIQFFIGHLPYRQRTVVAADFGQCPSGCALRNGERSPGGPRDRKSTRLNSSH